MEPTTRIPPTDDSNEAYVAYRNALVTLAHERARTGPPVVYLTDAQYVERLRNDPHAAANVALHHLEARGVFIRECIGDGGAPVRPERVERLLAMLAGRDGLAKDMAMDEARSITVRWRLL
jgi:hypothetical protein